MNQLDWVSASPTPHFDGKTYEAGSDHERLGKQLEAVRALMSDGRWRTLPSIARITGFPEASISARLRDLRKPKFGSRDVQRRCVGERKRGLFEYRVAR